MIPCRMAFLLLFSRLRGKFGHKWMIPDTRAIRIIHNLKPEFWILAVAQVSP
jgi:hypothetical protein